MQIETVKWSLKDMANKMRRSNMHIIGVPEGDHGRMKER